MEIFSDIADEILTLNGLEFKSLKLTIEIAKNPQKSENDKSVLPYNRRGTRSRRGDQGNLETSSKNRDTAVRLAPVKSSRQEETRTTPTDEELGFWDQSLEAVGEREPPIENNKSMAQELREKHRRLELEKRKQRQLLIEVDCNQRNIPENALPNASLIYTTLIEQMGLTNDRSSHQVEAIYQPDPNNF